MYADELLSEFKPKLNDYYYDVLAMWLYTHNTHGILKRRTKFDVKPTGTTKGYFITDLHKLEQITVYDKDSWLGE